MTNLVPADLYTTQRLDVTDTYIKTGFVINVKR